MNYIFSHKNIPQIKLDYVYKYSREKFTKVVSKLISETKLDQINFKVNIEYNQRTNNYEIQLYFRVYKHDFIVHVDAPKLNGAVDGAVKKLKRQINRYKGKHFHY